MLLPVRSSRHLRSEPRHLSALALGTTALGAAAFGAAALGALAIGALAVRRLAIGKARVRSLEIDELAVHRLRPTSHAGLVGDWLERGGEGPGIRPAIARIWRGRTRPEVADEYETYNYEAGVRPLVEKALGVQTFREDRETESEFITISYWESVEAMARFAGDDPTAIHHLPRDEEFLIELPEKVQILKLLHSSRDKG